MTHDHVRTAVDDFPIHGVDLVAARRLRDGEWQLLSSPLYALGVAAGEPALDGQGLGYSSENTRVMAVRLDEFDELETRAGADEDAILAVEESLGRKLPSEYRAFLSGSNGAFGFLGEEAYVNLWRVEELLELNALSDVELGWPGLTLFGTNGGADGFGFVWEDGRVQYICVPLIGFEKEYAVKSEHLWALLMGDADEG